MKGEAVDACDFDDLLRVTDEEAFGDVSLGAANGGVDGAGFLALGKDDAL